MDVNVEIAILTFAAADADIKYGIRDNVEAGNSQSYYWKNKEKNPSFVNNLFADRFKDIVERTLFIKIIFKIGWIDIWLR